MPDKGSQKISTFGSRLTSTVSVTLVLVLLGLASMLAVAAASLGRSLQGSLGFTVRLERGVADDVAAALCGRLEADRGIGEVTFISADSILAAETAALGAIALEPGVNPYNSEIEIKVKPDYATADSIAAMTAVYTTAEGVDEIVSSVEVVSAVETTLNRVRIVLVALGAVLLLISVALINNTVSLSIYSRRFSIHTMRLVGATAGFIRRPFVTAGAVNGLIAGIIASAVLCALRAWGAKVDVAVASALPWTRMAIVCSGAIVFGVVLCGLTSYFATNRYLAKSYDEMFFK